ncbi:MAG: response regulator transcription factor [Deltaproteobacteria bacterium]|nr:response regulator transcription factor [Deltaproteobacteria bacterium]
MENKPTIFLIDDHRMFREGIRTMLHEHAGNVIGEAGSGREGLQMALELNPDIVLMDIALQDDSGIELTRRILTIAPSIRVLILSMHSDIAYVAQTIQAGAWGFIVKESAGDKLREAVAAVYQGDYYLDPALTPALIESLQKYPLRPRPRRSADKAYAALTDREQEIMAQLAKGLPPAQIAENLFISNKTVENHRSNVMKKLNLKSPVELVHYAADIGIIDLDRCEK